MLRILVTESSHRPRLRARAGATRAMAVALLCVVALAGVGLGFALERLAMHNERGMSRRPGPGFGPPDGRRGGRDLHRGEDMRERLVRELDLTPEQARRVDSIMAQQMSDFRRLREAMQPRF